MTQVTTSAAAAKLAMVEISLAAAVIPAAWPVAQIVYFNQCDPETMIKTGVSWLEMSQQLGATRDELTTSVSTVTPLQWSGADRAAFEQHIEAYRVQLLGSQILAVAVGVALISVGIALLVLVITYVVVSTVLAVFAAFIAVAAATVVGSPAAASAMSTATSFATSAYRILDMLAKTADMIGKGGAAAIAAAGSFDVGMQLGTGNTDVLKNLVQATVDGLDNVAVGFLSKWERDFVGYGIHNSGRHAAGSPNGPGYLIFGGMTQVAPAGKDDDGDNVYGTGGMVDNIWSRFFGNDAWNH